MSQAYENATLFSPDLADKVLWELVLKMRLASLFFLSLFFVSLTEAQIQSAPPALVPAYFDNLSSKVAFEKEVWDHRSELLLAIDNSLAFLSSPTADEAYARFAAGGISRSHVHQSLERFRELLLFSSSSEELRESIFNEFMLYRSTGNDGQGTVRFTGYFQPVYKAARERSAEYRYPIYRMPADFNEWKKPHPTRTALEGYDGRGLNNGPLAGLELAWFKTRYEVFMIQLQGSALLELTDGTQMAVGFAAGTDYRFRGIPKEFLATQNVSWGNLGKHFARHPEQLNYFQSRNNRFIFFRENPTPDPIGSLGVPVVAERSIATDKLKMPPGALGLIFANIPYRSESGSLRLARASRFVLDHDTGSAIKGPGRVDIFMGSGAEGQQKANYVSSNGELYYLLLKES